MSSCASHPSCSTCVACSVYHAFRRPESEHKTFILCCKFIFLNTFESLAKTVYEPVSVSELVSLLACSLFYVFVCIRLFAFTKIMGTGRS